MMRRNLIASTILLTLLPAFSQSREVDIFSDLVSAFGGTKAEVVKQKEESKKSSSSPLDFVVAGDENAGILAALSSVTSDASKKSGASDIGVLNVIASAYGSNDFYQSGNWESLAGSASYYNPYQSSIAALGYPSLSWGRITSGFGYRERFKRMHKGIDIAMKVGDTVRSVLPGIIDRVNYEAKGYGHYVVIKHDDGMETRYAHLSVPLVMAGQRVNTGQPIALSGNTGNSTGPHLHFETRFFGTAVDPTTVFDFNGGSHIALGRYSAYNSSMQNAKSKPQALTGRSTYVVRPGDTLKKIADKAGISVYRLCQLNFLMDNEIPEPGTMLRLR